jgi:hypothetical protein
MSDEPSGTSDEELATAPLEAGDEPLESVGPREEMILARIEELRAARALEPVEPDEPSVDKGLNCATISICRPEATCVLNTNCTFAAAIADCVEDVRFVCGNVSIARAICRPNTNCDFAG